MALRAQRRTLPSTGSAEVGDSVAKKVQYHEEQQAKLVKKVPSTASEQLAGTLDVSCAVEEPQHLATTRRPSGDQETPLPTKTTAPGLLPPMREDWTRLVMARIDKIRSDLEITGVPATRNSYVTHMAKLYKTDNLLSTVPFGEALEIESRRAVSEDDPGEMSPDDRWLVINAIVRFMYGSAASKSEAAASAASSSGT